MTIDPDDPSRAVEAVLFAADEPRTIEMIRAHVGEVADVRAALGALADHYAGRGIELVQRGDRWHFQTAGDLAHLLRRDREEARKLSRAAIETLAIIAPPGCAIRSTWRWRKWRSAWSPRKRWQTRPKRTKLRIFPVGDW